jgi:hypothetical protein
VGWPSAGVSGRQNLEICVHKPILEGHIWILGCNQAPLSKDLVVEVEMVRAIYVIHTGSAYPQSNTNGCKKKKKNAALTRLA